ncbi:MAG: hypothetical protein AAGD43_24390 [Pseudomonadota bacterium]
MPRNPPETPRSNRQRRNRPDAKPATKKSRASRRPLLPDPPTREVFRPDPKQKYSRQMTEIARRYILSGSGHGTTALADVLGVSPRTIRRWKAEHKEFRDAIEIARDEAVEILERTAMELATGYVYDDVDVRAVDGVIVKTQVRRQRAPDGPMVRYLLENYAPEAFSSQQRVQLSGDKANPVVTVDQNPMDFARRLAFLLSQAGAVKPQ